MKIVYLAGPYRGVNPAETERNIRTAQRYAMALTEAGIGVYSPHLNTAHFDGLQPDQFFLDHGLEMLRRCDALVVMPAWQLSEGARREVFEAEKLMMPCHELQWFPIYRTMHFSGAGWMRPRLDKFFHSSAKYKSYLDSLPPRNQEGE